MPELRVLYECQEKLDFDLETNKLPREMLIDGRRWKLKLEVKLRRTSNEHVNQGPT